MSDKRIAEAATAVTFVAKTPGPSGWYFATNNPSDPTNQVLGWWDEERKAFTTFDAETPAILNVPPWVTVWNYRREKWDDSCGGLWSGPELWHGPIVSPWEFPKEAR